MYCLQFHNELHEEHTSMTIDRYKSEANKLETRMCAEHENQALGLGCHVCLSVFCNKCISDEQACADGKFKYELKQTYLIIVMVFLAVFMQRKLLDGILGLPKLPQ